MQFNEADFQIFEKHLKEFIDKHGAEAIESLYQLHRKLSKELFIKNFPTTEIFYYVLFDEIQKDKYKGLSFNQLADKMKNEKNIPKRTMYSFYKLYYRKRMNYIKREKELK
ncbi:MAG: hypothetical protein A2V66_07160 [Ignavibacteria bacterium RBG_13_36_8]|nr:MAG: hypothetical protein A2V66_07160 [Ignavibacteria bacterium RBG_13_36_8]